MFGKIVKTFSSGFLLETHETCYKTIVRFIPVNAVKKNEIILQFQVGDHVNYVNGVLQKEDFDNCIRCHYKSHAVFFCFFFVFFWLQHIHFPRHKQCRVHPLQTSIGTLPDYAILPVREVPEEC